MIDTYNTEVDRWKRRDNQRTEVNDFVAYDDTKIKWDRDLRQHLQRGRYAAYTANKMRTPLYRPFIKSNLFFDRILNNCVYLFPSIFPTLKQKRKIELFVLVLQEQNYPFTL